jgi:hypothetical protein
MSIVRFASVCDQCGKRGPEYQAYLSCRACGRDRCPECRNSQFSEEERGLTLCATGVGCQEEFVPGAIYGNYVLNSLGEVNV